MISWINFSILIGSSFLYVLVWYYLCVAEEKDLLIRYGTAYEEYCRRVGFWIPKKSSFTKEEREH